MASVPEYRALLAIDKLIAELDVTQQPEAAPAVETPVAEAAPAAEAPAAPAEQSVQETASLGGVLGTHDSYDSVVDAALSDVSSLSDLPAAAEPITATEAAAVVAEAPVAETPALETPVLETTVIETTVIETTVGEVAFVLQPETAPVAVQTAGEMPADGTGAERAA